MGTGLIVQAVFRTTLVVHRHTIAIRYMRQLHTEGLTRKTRRRFITVQRGNNGIARHLAVLNGRT